MSAPRGILGRYAAILEAIASSEGGLSLTEIMRATDLSSGTTYRQLNALVDIGYLSVDKARKTYTIGARLVRLYHLAQSHTTVSTLVQSSLHDLVMRFGETAFVAKLDRFSVETIAILAPENYSQSYVQPGRIMPINAAASAKAIFAFQPESVMSKALPEPLQKYTANTIVSRAKLLREFKNVRAQGFAVCADELDRGVLSYACPIHLAEAGVIHSIGIVALSERLNRFTPEVIVAAVRSAAGTIARRLEAGNHRASKNRRDAG